MTVTSELGPGPTGMVSVLPEPGTPGISGIVYVNSPGNAGLGPGPLGTVIVEPVLGMPGTLGIVIVTPPADPGLAPEPGLPDGRGPDP